eukprot:gene23340-1435_t
MVIIVKSTKNSAGDTSARSIELCPKRPRKGDSVAVFGRISLYISFLFPPKPSKLRPVSKTVTDHNVNPLTCLSPASTFRDCT